jgi:hypothetical protein
MENIEAKIRGDLTKDEWQELVALEYVLTWRYSDNEKEDLTRYRKLCKKLWNSPLKKL